jgi:ABC-type amino acid transport substrate-binding protein
MKYVYISYLFSLLFSGVVKAEFIFSAPDDAAIQKVSEQVLTEAYGNIGSTFSIKFFPNARSLLIANSGELDGEISRIEGLEKKFINLVRIPVAINYIEANSFVLNSNVHITASNWEDLRKYSLVCVNGVHFITQNLEKFKIECNYVTTFPQALEVLRLGRVDIAVLPKITGVALLKEEANDIIMIDKPIITMNLYHYIHKKNKDIIPVLQAELIKMQASGRIESIRKHYLENNGLH